MAIRPFPQRLPYFLRSAGSLVDLTVYTVLPLDLDSLWDYPQLSYNQCPCLVAGLLFLWRFFASLYFSDISNVIEDLDYHHSNDNMSFENGIWVHFFASNFCVAYLPKLIKFSTLLEPFFPRLSIFRWESTNVKVVSLIAKTGSNPKVCTWRVELGALFSASLVSLIAV